MQYLAQSLWQWVVCFCYVCFRNYTLRLFRLSFSKKMSKIDPLTHHPGSPPTHHPKSTFLVLAWEGGPGLSGLVDFQLLGRTNQFWLAQTASHLKVISLVGLGKKREGFCLLLDVCLLLDICFIPLLFFSFIHHCQRNKIPLNKGTIIFVDTVVFKCQFCW